MADQRPHTVLDAVRNVRQCLARANVLLGPLASLPVRLGRVAVVRQELGIEVVEMALLLVRRPVQVVAGVLDLLALRVAVVGEEGGDRYPGRVGLDSGCLLLLARLALLLLLCGAGFWCGGVGFGSRVRVVVVYRRVRLRGGFGLGCGIVDWAMLDLTTVIE